MYLQEREADKQRRHSKRGPVYKPMISNFLLCSSINQNGEGKIDISGTYINAYISLYGVLIDEHLLAV